MNMYEMLVDENSAVASKFADWYADVRIAAGDVCEDAAFAMFQDGSTVEEAVEEFRCNDQLKGN